MAWIDDWMLYEVCLPTIDVEREKWKFEFGVLTSIILF